MVPYSLLSICLCFVVLLFYSTKTKKKKKIENVIEFLSKYHRAIVCYILVGLWKYYINRFLIKIRAEMLRKNTGSNLAFIGKKCLKVDS